jgi:hypothetical protein
VALMRRHVAEPEGHSCKGEKVTLRSSPQVKQLRPLKTPLFTGVRGKDNSANFA